MRTLLLCAFLQPLIGKPSHTERWYQEKIALILRGKIEVKVPNGRIGVLTATHAIEVEFSSKWKQSIGQALWYSAQSGKRAGIVLIFEGRKQESVDAMRLEGLVSSQKLPIDVWIWPTDLGKVSEDNKHPRQP